jgi:hypothetical protein
MIGIVCMEMMWDILAAENGSVGYYYMTKAMG